MGLATAQDIAEKLMGDGLAPGTPVAIIEKATRPDQRVLRSLLADLGDLVAREKLVSPALIVVGDVVVHADALDALPIQHQTAIGALTA